MVTAPVGGWRHNPPVDSRNDLAGVEEHCHAERFIRSRIISACRSERSPRTKSQIRMIDNPGGGLPAFRSGGGCKFRIGRYQDAQPFCLTRGETVDR